MKRFVLLYIVLLSSILWPMFAATSTSDMPDGGWESSSVFCTTNGCTPSLANDPTIPFYSTSYMLDGKPSSDNSVSPSLSPRGPQRVADDNTGDPGATYDEPLPDGTLLLLFCALGMLCFNYQKNNKQTQNK